MQHVICSFSQRRVATIRHIDEGTIAGEFSLVNWQQLDAIAAAVMQLLSDLGLVDAGCVEVSQMLRRESGTKAMVPTVVIWGNAAISAEIPRMVDFVLEKFAEALKPMAPAGQGDLYPGAEPPADLTVDQFQAIDRAGEECAKLLGKSIRHSVALENADDEIVAVAEGALRPPASQLVGNAHQHHVKAILDSLGFSDFSIKLITDDGTRIDGNYASHEDFDMLVQVMRTRRLHVFEIVTRPDDKGRLKTVISLSSCDQ
jgi:hypothetical protein